MSDTFGHMKVTVACAGKVCSITEQGACLQVVKRHLLYAVAIISVVAVAMYTQQALVIGWFTRDAAVLAMAATALPLVAAFFPLDAVSSILDGTLTAAGQAKWTAKNTTFGAVVTFTMLNVAERSMQLSLVWVWVFLKLMTLLRLPMMLHRTFLSENSPFGIAAKRKRVVAVESEGVSEGNLVPAMQAQVSPRPIDESER